MSFYDLIVIGGGAAGFFGAINAKRMSPSLRVLIVEKSLKVLSKVRISGGGRCNVTHACYDPKKLIQYYPRGERELLGPFTRFQPQDTIAWFNAEGVQLKTEEDGRIFPISDSSETIITALMDAVKKSEVELRLGVGVLSVKFQEGHFLIETEKGILESKALLLATGSMPAGHAIAASFGHTITPLVPSLFTFNVPTSPLLDLAGISIAEVEASIEQTELKEKGPLLLTHWGFSGPAVLRLSAWGARKLHTLNYQATLSINWVPSCSRDELKAKVVHIKKFKPGQAFTIESIVDLPKNLARRLQDQAGLMDIRFSDISLKQIDAMIELLTASRFQISGKTTYKQEFVTCGGVKLNEVDFKTMQSRMQPGLYFAGEILDIDGVTGGFNFQNAWTTSYLAAKAIADSI